MTTITTNTTSNSSPSAAETQANDDPTTMRAVVQREYGTSETLSIEEVAVPSPGPTEVLIAVHAAGVDRGVVHLMTGLPYLVRLVGFGLLRPKQPVPGADVAGRVVAVGSEVGRFRPGDEVMGIATGAFAEFAVADQDKLVVRPDSVPVEHAAVATVSGITALQALTTVGRVRSGQRVLVLGASGGVGSFAVQLAVAHGATVVGTASAAKADRVRRLGASRVVDHHTTSVDEIGERFDLVIDIGGRNSLRRLRRVLTDDGTLVIVGGEDGGRVTGGIGRNLRAALMSLVVRQRLTAFISRESRESIEELAGLLADGSVEPSIGADVDLDGVAGAIHALEAGEVGGKTLVRVGR